MPQITIQQAFELAVQHHQTGQLNEAESLYRQILAVDSSHVGSLHCLGVIAQQCGRSDIAVDLIRQAITLAPDFPEAYVNLGNALKDKGQLDEAIAACRQAIALNPRLPEAHNNLGIALNDKGQLDDAVTAYRHAIALKPDFSDAYSNLGVALKNQGQLDEAIAAFRQAIALNPNYPRALNNLGVALKDTGQLDDAIAAFRQASALKPDFPEAHSNLIFGMCYHPSLGATAIAEEARRWNQQHAEPLRKLIQPHLNDRTPDRRLRIGYVSPDFRDHVVGRNVLPLLLNHNPRDTEIFCYAHVVCADSFTDRFRTNTHHWRDIVGLSDQQVAQQIRDDQIDVLVDLVLHTSQNRLLVFAHKPAPVQVTFAGYPGTTGMTSMDYRLTDPYLDPPETDESVYSEKTYRLPHTFWCYDPLEGRDLPVSNLPARSNGYITFGCLNNFCKVNDTVLLLWAKVLNAVPDSHLILLASAGSAKERVLAFFENEGIASHRVEVVTYQPRKQYIETYQRIDIGLDTLPYNGHTTSLDSFWMGVPVITLVGQTIVGRAGLCQLMNLGYAELNAHTPEQYLQIAAQLANDLPRLTDLRATLRQRMQASPLMDAPRFARDIEAAYQKMWRTWCDRPSLP
jgi:predicted O-linked N-acetylglucosamine transferase (SPINDLY family)